MNNRFSILIVLLVALTYALCWSSPATGENISVNALLLDNHNTKNKLYDSCVTIGKNARAKIMYYYQTGAIDSMQSVIECLFSMCGEPDTDSRLLMLQAIQDSKRDEILVENSIFRNTEQLQRFPEAWTRRYVGHSDANSKLYEDFTLFLGQYASDIIKELDTNSVAYLYALYYGSLYDKFYSKLRDTAYAGLQLRKLYFKEIRRVMLMPNPKVGFFAEGWHPTTNRGIFRNNVHLGLFIGARWLRTSLEITVGRRFGIPGSEFVVCKDGKSDTCKGYSSTHMGLDFMVHAIKFRRHEIDLSAGTGLEYLDVGRVSISAFPFYPGIGYRFFAGKNEEIFFGLHVRYLPFNFNNDGGSDMRAKGFSIRALYGFSDYFIRNSKLNALRYKTDRKRTSR